MGLCNLCLLHILCSSYIYVIYSYRLFERTPRSTELKKPSTAREKIRNNFLVQGFLWVALQKSNKILYEIIPTQAVITNNVCFVHVQYRKTTPFVFHIILWLCWQLTKFSARYVNIDTIVVISHHYVVFTWNNVSGIAPWMGVVQSFSLMLCGKFAETIGWIDFYFQRYQMGMENMKLDNALRMIRRG